MTGSLKDKAVKGMIWTSIERFGSQIIQFVIGIAIARILAPSDYGIIGLLSIFLALSNTFIDSGFGSALIQNKQRTETDYSTAFYFNAMVGLLLYCILFLSAPAIASFYDLPELCSITRVYTLILVFNCLTIVPITKLTIDLNFKAQSIISITTQLATGIVGLILAYNGLGVWALVYQSIFSCLLRLIVIFLYTKWIPKTGFSINSFKNLFSYGSKLLCSSIINTIYSNINSLIIGKMYAVSDVGYYNKGRQFPLLVANTLQNVVMKVAFPIMSEVQDDTIKLRNAYTKFLKMPMFVLLPALAILIVVAEPMILILLGEKWLPCVPYLQVLSLGTMFEPLTHINLNILYVKGRTDLVLKLELIKKPIAFAIIFISIQYGIIWLCLGQVLYSIIAYIFNCYYTQKYIQLGILKQIKHITPMFINTVLASVIAHYFIQLFSLPIYQFICGALCLGTLYLSLNYLTKEDCLKEYINIIRRKG